MIYATRILTTLAFLAAVASLKPMSTGVPGALAIVLAMIAGVCCLISPQTRKSWFAYGCVLVFCLLLGSLHYLVQDFNRNMEKIGNAGPN